MSEYIAVSMRTMRGILNEISRAQSAISAAKAAYYRACQMDMNAPTVTERVNGLSTSPQSVPFSGKLQPSPAGATEPRENADDSQSTAKPSAADSRGNAGPDKAGGRSAPRAAAKKG